MIKAPALIVFLMPFHTIALALPDVKSTIVTRYNLIICIQSFFQAPELDSERGQDSESDYAG